MKNFSKKNQSTIDKIPLIGISILEMGVIRVMGVMGLMRRKHKSKNSPAQQDSKMSKLGVGLMGQKPEKQNCPAQRDSEISKLGVGVLRILRSLRILGWKTKSENRPAQRDSPASAGSNLKTSPYRPLAVRLVPLCGDPYRPLDFKTRPAQRDSKMSNLGMGLIGPMGHIGLIGRKPVNNNRPAQRDSEISILKNRPLCPYCPLAFKIAPARRSSKNSILGMENIVPAESAKNTENRIFTMQVKNITGYFMGMEWNESMSKMQNISAQLDSKMSNLKIETESSFPQRYSKMSNGRLSVLLCLTHGQKAMFITRIKNMDDWFMGTMVE